MLSPLRNRFGIPGVISVIALVFAMFGGAYAATNDGGNATSSAKGKPGPRGKPGKPGPAGPQGPAGPAGPAGAKGDKGDKGDTGAQGKEGPQGKQGIQGIEGKPWTAGGTLPSGTTVTGTWTASSSGNYGSAPLTSISFPLPAKEGAEDAAYAFTRSQIEDNEFGKEEVFPDFFLGCKVEVGNPECIDTGCSGSALEPTAPKGKLCVYTVFQETNTPPEDLVASSDSEGARSDDYAKFGTAIVPLAGGFSSEAYFFGYGTWALNAP